MSATVHWNATAGAGFSSGNSVDPPDRRKPAWSALWLLWAGVTSFHDRRFCSCRARMSIECSYDDGVSLMIPPTDGVSTASAVTSDSIVT